MPPPESGQFKTFGVAEIVGKADRVGEAAHYAHSVRAEAFRRAIQASFASSKSKREDDRSTDRWRYQTVWGLHENQVEFSAQSCFYLEHVR
jgi:hypothetical protein